MPVIVPWQPNETSELVLQHLRKGDRVALPSESTFEIVASALHPEAVERLRRVPEVLPGVIVSAYPRLYDWLPLMRGASARLMRKLGAGPITLQAEAGYAGGLWSRLPEVSRQAVVHDGRLAVRWPAHAIWNELAQADLPLIAAPLRPDLPVGEVAQMHGELLACLIDAGPRESSKLPSVAQAQSRTCRLVVEGGLTNERFKELTDCRILFICTGNTCRSPMAAGLCAKLLADQLGCAANDLKQFGFCVQSAGLAAMMGAPASPDSVRVAAEYGADITPHRSGMVTLDLLRKADHIFAMTAGHWYTMKSIPVTPMLEPRLLSPDDEDVADPIGGELADYRLCAAQIAACLQARLPELLES